MWARVREHWAEVAWGVFATANLAAIVALRTWETIPFHLVWVSLTLVYGIRIWRLRSTVTVLAIVMVLSAAALLWTVVRGHERLDEVAEVPLMAAMFVAMVWHAERRQAAAEEARRLARTERVLLERQREFVRDASHELRTPITVARGHLDLAIARADDHAFRGDLEVVADELERLSTLSERLLLLAAADHSSFLSPRPVDVPRLLEETGRRWRAAADRDWRFEPRADGTVVADPQRLEVALDALIENAIEATDPSDRISVVALASDDRLVLEVADTGVGIPREQLQRVFERFARADADRGRGSGGTGLGLAIVRAIAHAHGGTVSIDSREGAGTAVRITLPGFVSAGDLIADAEPAAHTEPASDAEPAAPVAG